MSSGERMTMCMCMFLSLSFIFSFSIRRYYESRVTRGNIKEVSAKKKKNIWACDDCCLHLSADYWMTAFNAEIANWHFVSLFALFLNPQDNDNFQQNVQCIIWQKKVWKKRKKEDWQNISSTCTWDTYKCVNRWIGCTTCGEKKRICKWCMLRPCIIK